MTTDPNGVPNYLRSFAAQHGGHTSDRTSRLQSAESDQSFQARAEILAAYFLHHTVGLPLVGFEPQTGNGKLGDSLHRLPDGRSLFVEVKAPVEETLQKGSFSGSDLIRKQLKAAYPKLPSDTPALVVLICGGVMDSPTQDNPSGLDEVLYGSPIVRIEQDKMKPPEEESYIRNGFFQPGRNRRLSAVAVLDQIVAGERRPSGVFEVYHHPHATYPLDASVFAGFPQYTFDRDQRGLVCLHSLEM